MLKKAIIVLAVLGIGFVLGNWMADARDGALSSGAEQGSEDASGGERKVAYWRAPMDPSFTSDKPGKSPMGMDLVPVYEDELGAAGTVQIDPVTVQNIGVKTELVVKRPLSRRVRAVGRVDYDETRLTDINTKIAGWVEKLHVDYTGQFVKKGEPMLEIYSPELVAAQEEYLTALDYHLRLEASAAEDAIGGARDLLKAAVQRLSYWDITDQQIAELERTRKVKRRMTVYSPQEGIVVHKAVFDGAHINSGQHLYRIAELSQVWIYADIYEYELPWIKEGQQAKVELSYLPGEVFEGRVTYIYPYLEPKTRTVRVRMAFDNFDLKLKPEMYANVTIEVSAAQSEAVVPVQAVIRTGVRNIAIVSLGDGAFQPRDVVLGVEAEGYIQVLKGLRAGEKIVTSSQFLIDSESNLQAAVGGMSSSTMEEDEHAGHQMEEKPKDEHAGHQMGDMPKDEHAGHQMGVGSADSSQATPMDHTVPSDSSHTSHDHSAH